MRPELIRDLFIYLDRGNDLKVGNCPPKANQTLEEMPLPIDLKRVLQWYWTNNGSKVGAYNLFSVEEILARDDLSRLLALQMLQIGFAANGDPLVLRFSEAECEVGLLSHDQFWSEEEFTEDMYAKVTGSIDEFLWRAAEGRYLPVDYYAAAELLEMRREADGE